MELRVEGSGAVALSDAALGGAAFRAISVGGGVTALSVGVPLRLAVLEVGFAARAVFAALTVGTLAVGATVAGQADVPALHIGAFTPAAGFTTTAPALRYLFTADAAPATDALTAYAIADGVYRVGTGADADVCTVDGCDFVERDCAAHAGDLRRMTGVFVRPGTCTLAVSLRTIAYSAALDLSGFSGAVTVATLTVGAPLRGAFVVTDTLTFDVSGASASPQHTLALDVRGLRAFSVVRDGATLAPSANVVLFAGTLQGTLDGVRLASCAESVYTYTTAVAACDCELRGPRFSDGFVDCPYIDAVPTRELTLTAPAGATTFAFDTAGELAVKAFNVRG